MGEKPIIWGVFTIKEFIQYCTFGVMFAVFLIVSNQRLTLMEKNILLFTEFVYNSDNYHAAVLGTQFKNGKPVNDNFDTGQIRKILKPQPEGENQ